MRDALHKFLVLCGVALIILRLYPTEPGGFVSKLFCDDVIHTRIEGATVHVISFFEFTSHAYQELASNLHSLAHACALLLRSFY